MADGGTENPPCNRKGWAGNPPPKGARASALPDILALLVLARLAGRYGGRAAEAYAKTLKEDELRALACRRDGVTREYVTPSDTTFQRVMERTDPVALERVVQSWTQPRVAVP